MVLFISPRGIQWPRSESSKRKQYTKPVRFLYGTAKVYRCSRTLLKIICIICYLVTPIFSFIYKILYHYCYISLYVLSDESRLDFSITRENFIRITVFRIGIKFNKNFSLSLSFSAKIILSFTYKITNYRKIRYSIDFLCTESVKLELAIYHFQ